MLQIWTKDFLSWGISRMGLIPYFIKKLGGFNMPWLALAMAGASALSQQQKQDQERKQAAINTRYSPWTGIKPGAIDQNGALQGAMAGGAAGMAQQQNAQNSDAWRQWLDKNKANGQNTMPTSGVGPVANGGNYAASLHSFGPVDDGGVYGAMLRSQS